ncbi:hypothetical protein [Nocardia xishanensis]|uniref:hypothetical protein n=1 Tax=Nocardia xishanensis TaxID=238964 RepID=UPI0035A254CC
MVDVAELNALLLDSAGFDARAVVEQLSGPIGNRSAERAAAAAARHEGPRLTSGAGMGSWVGSGSTRSWAGMAMMR